MHVYVCTYQRCVRMYIPGMCTYVHTRDVYVCTYQGCVRMYIPEMCTYVHTRDVYVCTYQGCVRMYIPGMCTYVHTRDVYVCTYQRCVTLLSKKFKLMTIVAPHQNFKNKYSTCRAQPMIMLNSNIMQG